MFRKYIPVSRALKNQIVTAVEPILLSPLVNELTGFGQVCALTMLNHLFYRYGVINKIYFKENKVKVMGPYDPSEPITGLIKQLEKGGKFKRSGGQTISNAMMMSKGITLLAQTGIFQ